MTMTITNNNNNRNSRRNNNGNSNNNINNNNNHYVLGKSRFIPHVATPRRGLLPPHYGGNPRLANLPTSALPIPSSPALFREDTSYAWRPDYGGYLSKTKPETTSPSTPVYAALYNRTKSERASR